jgi:C1A family cysteine protease
MFIFLLAAAKVSLCPAANTRPSSGANASTTPDPQLQEPLHARGVPVPSRAQQEKIQQLPKIARVRLNALGIQRVTAAHRHSGGKSLLEPGATPAPFGKEIVLSTDPAVSTPLLTNTISSALPQTAAISPSGYADNSTLNAFPPIRSQDSQGSCAAFSTTYYQMTHMTALARDWDARNGSDAFHFSPKWTYNMINGGSDNGSFIDENLSIMRDHGGARWSDFPYTGYSYDFLAWCMTPTVWSNAISFRMNDFSTVPGLYDDTNLTTLKTILDNGYVVTFDTYSPWTYQGWVKGNVGNNPDTTNDDAYVGQAICKYVRALDWGHAMTIVGYNDNLWCDLNGNRRVDPGEKGALKIANSWGPSWGNNGFAWFAYDALKTDSAVTGWNPSDKVYGFGYNDNPDNCIAYVITPRTNYTPRFLARFTINHAQRGQIIMSVGKDTPSVTNNPSSTWTAAGLNNSGGSFAFNGTSSACDGTFFLDLSDLVTDPYLSKRYFVGMTSSSGTGQLKSYSLLDTLTGETITVSPSNTPSALNPSTGIVRAGTAWGWADMGSSASGSSNCIAMSTTAVTIRDSSEWRLVKA